MVIWSRSSSVRSSGTCMPVSIKNAATNLEWSFHRHRRGQRRGGRRTERDVADWAIKGTQDRRHRRDGEYAHCTVCRILLHVVPNRSLRWHRHRLRWRFIADAILSLLHNDELITKHFPVGPFLRLGERSVGVLEFHLDDGLDVLQVRWPAVRDHDVGTPMTENEPVVRGPPLLSGRFAHVWCDRLRIE